MIPRGYAGRAIEASLIAATLLLVPSFAIFFPPAFAADTSPPSVNIVFPLNGGTYTGTVTWSTTVTDNVGVSLVYFYIDGDFWQSVQEMSPGVYSTSMSTTMLSNGQHTLTVYAWDTANPKNRGENSVTITASNVDTTKPTTVIEQPLNGETVVGMYELAIRAYDVNEIERMELYIDNVFHSALDNPPFETTPAGTFQYFRPIWNTATSSNGSHTLLAKAYDPYGNVGTRTITVTVAPDTAPPTVSLLNPSNGATISNTINVVASASDNVGVSKVEFYVDNVLKSTDTTQPSYSYSLNTATLSNGSHTIKATAYDAANNQSSAQVSVTVDNTAEDTRPPSVSITSPSNGASVKGIITVEVSASDNIGVSRVEMYVDDTLKGTDTASPYSFTLDTKRIQNGLHSIMVKAFDGAGNSAISSISVRIVG